MTYELYVFDTEQVSGLEGAREAHEAMPYFERSRPVSDQGARKWRTIRALQASSRDLTLMEPEKPKRGEEEMRYAQLANLETAHALCLNIFDDAVEIVLEVPDEPVDAEQAVKATFACLLRLELEGYACVYDAQLDRLLNLSTDEALLSQSYASEAGMMQQGGERSRPSPKSTPQAPLSAPLAAEPGSISGGSKKPWWKIWK
ncbi:MAG: hypothetical protein FJY37_00645 [Betaproteobacteria bacterium]|nr:hypothetical protein [Betaproteobacteria bacterium]